MQLVCTGTRLGTKFHVKGKAKEEHYHDLTDSVKCPMRKSYNGKTGRRLLERVNELCGKVINYGRPSPTIKKIINVKNNKNKKLFFFKKRQKQKPQLQQRKKKRCTKKKKN